MRGKAREIRVVTVVTNRHWKRKKKDRHSMLHLFFGLVNSAG
jgi:hypothetical protein